MPRDFMKRVLPVAGLVLAAVLLPTRGQAQASGTLQVTVTVLEIGTSVQAAAAVRTAAQQLATPGVRATPAAAPPYVILTAPRQDSQLKREIAVVYL